MHDLAQSFLRRDLYERCGWLHAALQVYAECGDDGVHDAIQYAAREHLDCNALRESGRDRPDPAKRIAARLDGWPENDAVVRGLAYAELYAREMWLPRKRITESGAAAGAMYARRARTEAETARLLKLRARILDDFGLKGWPPQIDQLLGVANP